jgi:phosphoglycolate phosphatase
VVGEVGDRLGVGFTDREANLIWYGPGEAREATFARNDVDPEAFWGTFHEVDRPETRAEASYVYDDAAAAVPELSGPVGVVTHCQEYLTGPILEALDIGDWFDTVVCCTHETGWKPDPTPVELAVSELGVRGDREGAMAGDDPSDVRAAHNAGLDGIHVARDGHRGGEVQVEDAPRVRRLTDLSG